MEAPNNQQLYDDQQKACDVYRLYSRYLQIRPDSRKIYRSIAFADDNFYPQLQAADLLAWITRTEALHRFHGEDFSLRELFSEMNTRLPGDILEMEIPFWDREHIAKLKNFKKHKRAHHAIMKPNK